MAQKRFYNYGDFINTPDTNLARYAVTPKGVYRGFGLSVNTDNNVEIQAGYGCQHNGIVWMEDGTRTLIFTATGAAKTETVVALHDDQPLVGGAAVTYELQSGIVTDASLTNGVVLGWIYYPGGAIPLDQTHLVDAPSQLSADAISSAMAALPKELLPPFHLYSDIAAMGANVTLQGLAKTDLQATPRQVEPLFDVVNFVVYQDVAKTAGPLGFELLTQHVPFFATAWAPVSFSFYLNMTAGAQLDVELRDTDLNTVSIPSSPIVGAGAGWEWVTVTVSRTALISAVFTENEPFELRLVHNVDVGHSIKLARIVATFWPYPS